MASFVEGGVLTGSAGCNNHNASYATDGGRIEIAKPATTKKACPEPAGIMEQEARTSQHSLWRRRTGSLGRSLELLSAEGTLVASFTRGQGR